MSKSYSRTVQKKLIGIIETSTDNKEIIEAANVLAKYMPRPKQPKRRKGTSVGEKPKEEVSLDQLVAAMEKGRKGQALTAEEQKTFERQGVDINKFTEAVERKRKEQQAEGSAVVA